MKFKLFKRKREKFALTLMGGGARGLSHIGVLDVLEENGLIPDIITGTSMGAIVGGLYASGLSPKKMEKLAFSLDLRNFINAPKIPIISNRLKKVSDYLIYEMYLNLLSRKRSLSEKDTVEEFLKDLVGDIKIEDLKIKFACNAVDLVSGKEVVFDKGCLYKAIRASMSLPIIFEPVKIDDMVLVDGGALNNAPVDIAKKLGAEKTVLVDIHIPPKRVEAEKLSNTFLILERILDSISYYLLEEKIKHADFIIRIPLNIDTLDFSEPLSIIERGREETRKIMPELKEFLGLHFR
ncbi:MAG: patatin-like phospholipase family protein [Caldisericia bacterium]|nr:patatin-like phospholipase family protein [Caldisericia bacterium]